MNQTKKPKQTNIILPNHTKYNPLRAIAMRICWDFHRPYIGYTKGRGGLYQYKWMEWHCLTSPTCMSWVVLCNSVHPLNQYLIWYINRRRVHWFMSSERMFYIYITSFASCIVLLTIYLWKKTPHQNLPKTSKEKSEKNNTFQMSVDLNDTIW